MPPFDVIRGEFVADGRVLLFRVDAGPTSPVWRTLVERLTSNGLGHEYFERGAASGVTPFPGPDEIFERSLALGKPYLVSLRVWLGVGTRAVLHFVPGIPILISLGTGDVGSQEALDALVAGMETLGEAIDRDLTLTQEYSDNAVILKFSTETNRVYYVGSQA